MNRDIVGNFRTLWKVLARGEMKLSFTPTFSGQTENLTSPITRDAPRFTKTTMKQVEDFWEAKHNHRIFPHGKSAGALFHENNFPAVIA